MNADAPIPFSIEEATALYIGGASSTDLGARYGWSANKVLRHLRAAGVPTRGRGGNKGGRAGERDWKAILQKARAIVKSYDTPVTLRQLHYRLVSTPDLYFPNDTTSYGGLGKRTAALRRGESLYGLDDFPDLADDTRRIHEYPSYASPAEALLRAARVYNRDGQETQDYLIFLGVEKRGMVAQLDSWFTIPFDVPVVALGGYLTTPLRKKIISKCEIDGRPPVLLYAGDLDPTGIDIFRHIKEESGVEWYAVEQVALRVTQTDRLEVNNLDELDKSDSRSVNFLDNYRRLFPDEEDELDEFAAEHGEDFQVELDALDPDDLRRLFEEALEEWHDEDKVDEVRERQADEQRKLSKAIIPIIEQGEPNF
jgi:hypothetical protein